MCDFKFGGMKKGIYQQVNTSIYTYADLLIYISKNINACINQLHTTDILRSDAQSWFQTSLPLAPLLLHHMITHCRFKIAALSGHAALVFSPSGIALKFDGVKLSMVCRCGQSGGIID